MHKWRYFLSERWLLTLLSGLEWSLSCIPGRTSCSPPDLLCIFHLNIRIVWLCYLQKIHRLACSYSALRFLSFILIAPCKILMFHQLAYCYLWLPAVKRLLQFLPFWWNYKDKKKKKRKKDDFLIMMLKLRSSGFKPWPSDKLPLWSKEISFGLYLYSKDRCNYFSWELRRKYAKMLVRTSCTQFSLSSELT